MDVAKFEQYLLDNNVIQKPQLTQARTLSASERMSVIEALVELNVLDAPTMGQYMAAFSGMAYAPIAHLPPPPQAADVFSARCGAYWKSYPYAYDSASDTLSIAVYTTMQTDTLRRHHAFFMLPHRLAFTIASKPEIEEAISVHWGIEVRRKVERPLDDKAKADQKPKQEKIKLTTLQEAVKKRRESPDPDPPGRMDSPMASVRLRRPKPKPAPAPPPEEPAGVPYERMSLAVRSLAVQLAIKTLEGDHTKLTNTRALVRYCQLLATRMNLSPPQTDGLLLAAWLSALREQPEVLLQIQLPYDISGMLVGAEDTGVQTETEAIIFSLIRCFQEMKDEDPQMATDVNLTRRNLRNRWQYASDHQDMLETFLQVLMDEAFLKELSHTVGKILLVDPNEIGSSTLSPPLTSDGYEVMVVPDADNLTDILPEFEPDLIMVESNLPKGDSLKLCRELKRNEDTASLKLLALVGDGGEKRAAECLRAGADDYLLRPVSLELMFLKIQRLLELEEGSAEDAGVTGSLADMSFTDMIQVLSAGGKSMDIALSHEDKEGHVVLQAGEIIHARENDDVGEKAFYSLMRWTDGEFVTRQISEFPERTVHGTTMGLLMEGARQVDEGLDAQEGYQAQK